MITERLNLVLPPPFQIRTMDTTKKTTTVHKGVGQPPKPGAPVRGPLPHRKKDGNTFGKQRVGKDVQQTGPAVCQAVHTGRRRERLTVCRHGASCVVLGHYHHKSIPLNGAALRIYMKMKKERKLDPNKASNDGQKKKAPFKNDCKRCPLHDQACNCIAVTEYAVAHYHSSLQLRHSNISALLRQRRDRLQDEANDVRETEKVELARAPEHAEVLLHKKEESQGNSGDVNPISKDKPVEKPTPLVEASPDSVCQAAPSGSERTVYNADDFFLDLDDPRRIHVDIPPSAPPAPEASISEGGDSDTESISTSTSASESSDARDETKYPEPLATDHGYEITTVSRRPSVVSPEPIPDGLPLPPPTAFPAGGAAPPPTAISANQLIQVRLFVNDTTTAVHDPSHWPRLSALIYRVRRLMPWREEVEEIMANDTYIYPQMVREAYSNNVLQCHEFHHFRPVANKYLRQRGGRSFRIRRHLHHPPVRVNQVIDKLGQRKDDKLRVMHAVARWYSHSYHAVICVPLAKLILDLDELRRQNFITTDDTKVSPALVAHVQYHFTNSVPIARWRHIVGQQVIDNTMMHVINLLVIRSALVLLHRPTVVFRPINSSEARSPTTPRKEPSSGSNL